MFCLVLINLLFSYITAKLKVAAEISTFFIGHPFRLRLTTIVVRRSIIKTALHASVLILVTMGALVAPVNLHHEFDLRNAYGDTDGRDLLDIQFAAAGHVKSMRANFSASNTPTIRVEASDSGMGWDIGHEEPVATLTATSFELMRAIGGRRTRSEMAAMGWDNDPEPFLDHMTPPHLHVRETSLHE